MHLKGCQCWMVHKYFTQPEPSKCLQLSVSSTPVLDISKSMHVLYARAETETAFEMNLLQA